MSKPFIGPSSPKWIYENGVPELEMEETINPLGKKRTWTFPYYLSEAYQIHFDNLISNFGVYLQSLPKEQLERILFIQAAEGSTGDGQPYKGNPIDKKYYISKEEWEDFRIKTWETYQTAVTFKGKQQIPLLVNFDSKNGKTKEWLLDKHDAIGLKNGMFSHGYHISEGKKRLSEWNEFKKNITDEGTRFFSRGEQDGEWAVYGWSVQNPKQAFYWSALYATHNGLSMWNVPWKACLGYEYQDAIVFFNRYANQHNPLTATEAFCALRKGLDAADVTTYPEAEFGKAKRTNMDRYKKVADAYAAYGAIQGDPSKAIKGGMLNRKRDDYNDVGWGILDSNYERFISQIEPEKTSLAWWHIGPKESVYSRFARSTNCKKNQKTLFFDVNDEFVKDTKRISLRITWLDRGKGKWSLNYTTKKTVDKKAYQIKNTNTGVWRTKEIILEDIDFKNKGERGSDFVLKSLSNEDVIFHKVEISKH